MEYVVITYPMARKVRIDGQEAGFTNATLLVEEGHHIFDLGDPLNYYPGSFATVVHNTTSILPLIIKNFQPSVGNA